MIRITLILLSTFISLLASGMMPIAAETTKVAKKTNQDNSLAVTDHLLCQNQTHRFEKALRIPPYLLTAISVAEAGKWNKKTKALSAWPWTIMAKGKTFYMPSKQTAISKVRLLQAEGIKNIDIGCMQINLYYHPKAFENLNAAFDPERNVAYAANFLAALNQTTLSWPQAAANYHSTTISKNKVYLNKVLGLWQKLSNKNIHNSGFHLSPDPAYSDLKSRSAQTAVLKSRFRARLHAERNAKKPDRKKQDLKAWRRGRFEKDLYKTAIALKKAKRAATDKNYLNQGKKSFPQIRKAQLSQWRKTRNGTAFRKKQ